MNEKKLTHLDLFSGIGGFALAAQRAGFKTVGFCENNPFCQEVLRKQFPNVPIFGDIKDFTREQFVFTANSNGSNGGRKNSQKLKDETGGGSKARGEGIQPENREACPNNSQSSPATVADTTGKRLLHEENEQILEGEGCNKLDAGQPRSMGKTIANTQSTGQLRTEQYENGNSSQQRGSTDDSISQDTQSRFATTDIHGSGSRAFAGEADGNRQEEDQGWQGQSQPESGRQDFQIDLITGGFPCQPFSAAGKRLGTSDNRHLWPEMYRVIQEFKPRWVIAENVSGILNIEGGMVFEQVCLDMEAEGYEVQTLIIPACAVKAPHRRDRVWIISHSRRKYGQGITHDGEAKGTLSSKEATIKPERSTSDDRQGTASDSEHTRFVATEIQGKDNGLQQEEQTRQELCHLQSERNDSLRQNGKRNGRNECQTSEGKANSNTDPMRLQEQGTQQQASGDRQYDKDASNSKGGESWESSKPEGRKDTGGGNKESGITSNSEGERRELRGGEKGDSTQRQEELSGCKDSNDPNPDQEGLEGRQEARNLGKSRENGEQLFRGQISWDEPWLEIATRFCRMDDGVSTRVDGISKGVRGGYRVIPGGEKGQTLISEAKHRVERLKALGNAIVPQVAVKIIKCIGEIERGRL